MVVSNWRSGAVEREDDGKWGVGRRGEHHAGAVAVDHAVLAPRTRWQEWERHQMSGDAGRSGSATCAQHDCESRSRGMNRVVVELASVEAIVGDELGQGALGGAPVSKTMGWGRVELT
jgi:hypothetical protein